MWESCQKAGHVIVDTYTHKHMTHQHTYMYYVGLQTYKHIHILSHIHTQMYTNTHTNAQTYKHKYTHTHQQNKRCNEISV